MARSGRKHAVKVAIGAAAVGVTTSVVGVAVTQPASISASLVDLAALIVVGSSTNPSGAGVADFFDGKFRDEMYTGPGGNDIIYVNFFEGPAGIQAAIDSTDPDEQNAVLASGWGAANASLLLHRDDPRLGNTVFILDNDVARPDGGFGTRYPLFALIGVNPYPTPSETAALRVVNTGYEYDYNSNAPAYVLNPFSALNSLAAYLTTRLNQAEIDLPVDAEGRPIAPDGSPLTCAANTCAITESRNVIACEDARCSSPGDRITAYVTTRGNTTYVTYTTRELPLTTLVRSVFGDYIADVTAPLLKLAVDFGYYGGNPIPTDPSAYRPGALLPSPADVLTTLAKLPRALEETLAAATAPFQQGQLRITETEMLTEDVTEEVTEEVTETQTSTTETSIGATTTGTFTTEKLAVSGDVTEDTSKPLMNVLREGLNALPGGSTVKIGNGNGSITAPTDPESVEPQPISDPEEGVDPTGIDPTGTDTNPGDNDDGSSEGGEAAAA